MYNEVMFNKYQATPFDLDLITESLSKLNDSQIKILFPRPNLLKKISLVSFDSNRLYLWSQQKLVGLNSRSLKNHHYTFYSLEHHETLNDEVQMGWQANVYRFRHYLPKSIQSYPCISGGLPTPFMMLHQKTINDSDIFKHYWSLSYSTPNSFQATIIHEFAHAFFGLAYNHQNPGFLTLRQKVLAQFNDNDENKLTYKIQPEWFMPQFLSELYAFCSEYYASNIFWKKHQEFINQMNKAWLLKYQNDQSTQSLDIHLNAAILGTILLKKYPQQWPQLILNNELFSKL